MYTGVATSFTTPLLLNSFTGIAGKLGTAGGSMFARCLSSGKSRQSSLLARNGQ